MTLSAMKMSMDGREVVPMMGAFADPHANTRVLLVDDHTLVRAGLVRLVQGFFGFEVIGEASNCAQAVELTIRHKPDLVLLDLSLPDKSGLEALPLIRRHAPNTRAVMMSMHDDPQHVREALDRGASGFIVKDAATLELELALRTAVKGETFLSPRLSSKMLSAFMERETPSGIDALPPRQREIFDGLGQGLSNKEIAANLGISVKTVNTHRARMMETLGCRRANQLVLLAIQHRSLRA